MPNTERRELGIHLQAFLQSVVESTPDSLEDFEDTLRVLTEFVRSMYMMLRYMRRSFVAVRRLVRVVS